MKFLLSAAGKVTYDALEDPNQWTAQDHTITHKRSGVQLWTSNGRFYFKVYNPRGSDPDVFNVVDKLVLHPKARHVRRELVRIEGRERDRADYIARITGLEEP